MSNVSFSLHWQELKAVDGAVAKLVSGDLAEIADWCEKRTLWGPRDGNNFGADPAYKDS